MSYVYQTCLKNLRNFKSQCDIREREYFVHMLHIYTQIAVKREDAVTKEISRKLAEDKKMSKKEKDER